MKIKDVMARDVQVCTQGIETLEELETAAHDGRLSEISGIGEKRLAGIIDSLAGRLGRVRERFGGRAAEVSPEEPSGAELLDVDRQYRENAAAGVLRMIAPRRFNLTGEAWLPILHTERGPRHYTALFSNTSRAHQFKKTRDWVILIGLRGHCAGRRIVRGRESECTAYYQAQALRESAVTRR